MSLENTLREMMNEAYGSMVQQAAAKIRKEGTPETIAHQKKVREHELLRGAIRRLIPSTKDARDVAVHQAQDLANENPVPISRRERRTAARARTARGQSLMEHYKQRLRERLNEMKMPPYKEPLNPTVHSGPEEKPLPPGVHTGPQKPPVPSHTGSQKPKPKPSEITRKPRGGMQGGY